METQKVLYLKQNHSLGTGMWDTIAISTETRQWTIVDSFYASSMIEALAMTLEQHPGALIVPIPPQIEVY